MLTTGNPTNFQSEENWHEKIQNLLEKKTNRGHRET